MNRTIFLLLIFLFPLKNFSQWRPLDIPSANRYDDVFFIDENTGWAVNGERRIYKTTDGGATWTLKFQADNYLRSIEFATPMLGYAGSLRNSIYRTLDGGETWENISENVDFDITYNGVRYTEVPGACSLSAPSENVVFACAIWSGSEPAYVAKSTDAGDSWVTTDMTTYATQLVDVLFLNENEGFLTGRNDPIGEEKGGVILYTDDGGETWTTVLETGVAGDYIWKIQTPDSVNFFGSIQSLASTNNVRFVKSSDGGQSWTIHTVQADKWNYMQMVGFKDELTGWTGGTANPSQGSETALFQTNDGGDTWGKIETHGNSTFNRFFMFSDELIFLTGRRVYKYDDNYPDEEVVLSSEASFHELSVSPNPTNSSISIDVQIAQFTRTRLELLNSSGQLIKMIQLGFLDAGNHSFNQSLEGLEAGLYFLSLHTNEGLNYSRIIKE